MHCSPCRPRVRTTATGQTDTEKFLWLPCAKWPVGGRNGDKEPMNEGAEITQEEPMRICLGSAEVGEGVDSGYVTESRASKIC